MAMKDRLATLRGSSAAELESQDDETEGQDDEYLARFFNNVNELKQSINVIDKKVKELTEVHSRILRQTDEEAGKDKNAEETINAEIRKEGSFVRRALKNMDAEIEKAEAKNQGQLTSELRIKKTQQATLSRNFIDVMTAYNKAQNDYRNACKEKIRRKLEAMGHETSNDQLEQMIRSSDSQVFANQMQEQQAHQTNAQDDRNARMALTDVEMRHQEILKLEKSLQELNELFLDMARLVESQGEMIDRIENNVEQSTNIVAKAKEETKKAVKYQKAARKKKIIIGCVIAAVIIIVVVIIVVNVT